MPDSQVVNIGRPGLWGNQFTHLALVAKRRGIVLCTTREESVQKHREWFMAPEQAALRERAKRTLRGKTLWCPGCRGTKPCHGEVIEEVANA